jgi:hypothetical protein
MYAQTYVGRVGSSSSANKSTISAWQTTITSDHHSVKVLPSFIDNTQHLKLSNYAGLECSINTAIEKDIEGTYILGSNTTNMGAYHGLQAVSGNAALLEVLNWRDGSVLGQTDAISVLLQNRGADTLKTVTIEWLSNGLSQPPATWTGSLAPNQSTIASLGTVTYIPAENTLQAWIKDLGTLTDLYPHDDTISITGQVCLPLKNVYIIGTDAGSDFVNVADALAYVRRCGVNGNLTFKILPGTYNEINLSGISSSLGGNKLTITSSTDKANDVIITRSSNGAGITLSQSNNIIIKDITVDVTARTSNSYAIQFTGACTNVLIRDCNLLTNPAATATNAISVIHKANNTGIVDSIFCINNTLDGGSYGVYFYVGTASTYGKNIIFDSNTVSNQYTYATFLYYNDFTSCSYNTILSRETGNIGSSWNGLYMEYTNGPIVGNRIIQRSKTITSPCAIDFTYYNNRHTTDTGLIANNEIIIHTASTSSYGIYAHNTFYAKILHNSIFASGTGMVGGRGIYINSEAEDILELKNNNIVMKHPEAFPIYLSTNITVDQYDIDCNNIYAPKNVGYAGGAKTSMEAWRQIVTTDKHSVSILPLFVDTAVSLELSSSDGLLCKIHPDVPVDINNAIRPAITALGAYVQKPALHDAMLLGISPWKDKFVRNQTLQIHVDMFNLCDLSSVTSATFGWRINGQLQPTKTWNAPSAIQPYKQQNILVGYYKASNEDTVNVEVWIESLNGQADTITWNDTVTAVSVVAPLAEFVAPFVEDTIWQLTCTVNVLIRPEVGATLSPPQMTLYTTLNEEIQLRDTITMVQNGNDIWQAHIPQQYYGCKLVYSTTISDTVGNAVTLIDSTYMDHFFIDNDTVRIVGAATSSSKASPYHTEYNQSWSRAIYMDWEISNIQQGGTITQISYYNTTGGANNVDSLSMYFKAVSDSIITYNGYLDPLTDSATLVWGKATKNISGSGWVDFTLHTPFNLPPNANLMVYWNNEDGSCGNNGSYLAWRYTIAPKKHIRSYSDTDPFPTKENLLLDGDRPNAKFVLLPYRQKYAGYNLGILALTSPVNKNISGKSCSDEHASIKILMVNTGENDYDFSTNNVMLSVEVNNPVAYTVTKILDTDILKSGEIDTIEITSLFPVYRPGQYDIKVWLTSIVDNIIYDDTITSVYISERLGLPIEKNFSNSFPSEFISEAITSSTKWTIVSQGSGADTVVNSVFGSGMLAFTGTRGAMTHLSTRQLELRGTVLPAMEFWYFHDTIESEDYMDVRITTDGGATYTQLLSLLKQHTVYGWKHYTADLTPYINGQCINILFEAMQMSSDSVAQYIDSINISSFPDLAISELLLPEVTVCDMKNKAIGVVLSAIVNRAIDLSIYNTSLIVEIPNHPTNIIPLFKRIDRNSSDTVWIRDINFPTGNNTVRAYLSVPVDIFSTNDTLEKTININPKMFVSINSESMSNCLRGEDVIHPTITLSNTGDMDFSNIGLLFQIDTGETGTPPYVLFEETCTDTILAGGFVSYTFTNSYIVPWRADFHARITAWLLCDSTLINTTSAITECIDSKDLYLMSIDNPSAGNDKVGDPVQVRATLLNRSDHDNYTEINITVRVENSQRIEMAKFVEKTGTIGILETVNHHFTHSYTVPNDTVYYLTVYIDHYENYPNNDTITITRYTDGTGIAITGAINVFALGQNIPNPANNSTRIDYSIPEVGEVVFHVHSISGQLLYSKTIEAARGIHSLELNTSTFAAGVYFYSMEYKGQKHVKQLIISN